MSGTPLPVSDLPTGTVTVRVVRESLANNLPSQPVELQVGSEVKKGATDAGGRVQFDGVAAGAQVQARATVDGELLRSQTFADAGTGGHSTDPGGGCRCRRWEGAAAHRARPRRTARQPGGLTLDAQSRILIELADEALEIYYILELASGASQSPSASFVIDLPPGARSVTMLEGSTPQATVAGTRVTVAGPIQAGRTPVQSRLSACHTTVEARASVRRSPPSCVASACSFVVTKGCSSHRPTPASARQ